MNFSLVIIGAHNGGKLKEKVGECLVDGNVLLVEPVPWLFEELKNNYKGMDRVLFLNAAVSTSDSESCPFYAPQKVIRNLCDWGDEIGSLNKTHSEVHLGDEIKNNIQEINVKTLCFDSLLNMFNATSIKKLQLDAEGLDAKILMLFPFERIRPEEIVFEYKHSDGEFNIGRNFGNIVSKLDSMSYRTQIISEENCKSVDMDKILRQD